jgi:hypothetical protein
VGRGRLARREGRPAGEGHQRHMPARAARLG